MNKTEFIKKLYDVLQNHKTEYFWGSFGQPITSALIESKCKQYPDWYRGKREGFEKLVGKGYYAFDCVGLIKGILWGWKDGQVSYGSNHVPDTSANGMLGLLKGVSSNFTDIEAGEAVWMDGHIGVYVGDGKVIESTPAWETGVQLTACLNVKAVPGLHGRKWTKHGRLPWVDYTEDQEAEKPTTPEKPATPKPLPKPATKTYTVKAGDTLSAIADKNNTTVDRIVKLNGIKNPNVISVGLSIKLP